MDSLLVRNNDTTFRIDVNLVDEHLKGIRSLAELKVTLFIIRHTFYADSVFKKISINDFINGIYDKERNLKSCGIGLARQHIIRGINLAEQRGTILVYREGIKEKWYCINTPENSKLVEALNNKEISLTEILEGQRRLSNMFK